MFDDSTPTETPESHWFITMSNKLGPRPRCHARAPHPSNSGHPVDRNGGHESPLDNLIWGLAQNSWCNRHKNIDFPRKAGENPEIYSCNIGMEDVPWRNDWPLHHGDSGFNVCVSYSCWFHRTRIACMDRFPTKSSWSQLAQTFQSEPPAHHLIFTERKSENPGLVEVCPTARTRV